jgi:hypothetical protein
MTELTDAEKLAQAEAMMAAAAEQAKAARLPSAEAAVDLLSSAAGQAFLADLKAAVAASVDDLSRPLGTQGVEGTKQMLQRIVTSYEAGLSAAQTRVASLQPTAVAPAPAEPEA